jgi:hypothetical protein
MSRNIIIIKYSIEGDFIEGNSYDIDFQWNKCLFCTFSDSESINLISGIANNSNTHLLNGLFNGRDVETFPIDYIKKYDGLKIHFIYNGCSTDGNKIFLINMLELERDIKIKEIFKKN